MVGSLVAYSVCYTAFTGLDFLREKFQGIAMVSEQKISFLVEYSPTVYFQLYFYYEYSAIYCLA